MKSLELRKILMQQIDILNMMDAETDTDVLDAMAETFKAIEGKKLNYMNLSNFGFIYEDGQTIGNYIVNNYKATNND